MKVLEPKLSFKIAWKDEHMLQIQIEACNSEFLGTTQIYISHGELGGFAKYIAGFPKDAKDKRHYQFGNDLAYLILDFYCLDRVGHAAIFLQIGAEWWNTNERRNEASFQLDIEPAGQDRFRIELEQVDKAESGQAVLQGIVRKR